MQKHPEKTNLRDQLITYILGESDFSVEELEELLNNIFSPVLKQEIMITGTGFLAVAAREAAAATAEAEKAKLEVKKVKARIEKAKQETIQVKMRTAMRGWEQDLPSDIIVKIVDLPPSKIMELIAAFDKVKSYYLSKKQFDMKVLKKLSGLQDTDLKALWVLLQQQK